MAGYQPRSIKCLPFHVFLVDSDSYNPKISKKIKINDQMHGAYPICPTKKSEKIKIIGPFFITGI